MARAETRPKLPLDTWAKLIGLNPMHFNGVYFGQNAAVCEQPWLQFPWQTGDRVGREELAEAIAQAEADIEAYLGYRLLPSWEEDEWHATIRPLRKDLFNITSTDIRGFAQMVQAKYGHMISGGVRAGAPLVDGIDAAVLYTDVDGDDYWETATVTATVPVGTDPCEIRVYFPVSNVMVATGGEDQWEIRPISVSIVGVNATIKFRREQAVMPEFQLDYVPPDDDSHLRGVDGVRVGPPETRFLNVVDVYRVYNDPQTQALIHWEPLGIGCDSCNGTGCAACEYAVQTACLMARGDLKNSLMAYKPATWNAATASFDAAALAVGRQPDGIRLWYYAGLRQQEIDCPTIEMTPYWQRIVAYYASAVLDRMVCACTNVHEFVEYWQKDMAISGDEGLRIPDTMLDNPFGTRRGALYAWQRVKQGAMMKAALPL